MPEKVVMEGTMPKTVFAYRQSVDKANTYELYIYDDITKYGDFDWETWSYKDSETSANHIREVLQNLPDGTALDIHINSNGGEAFEAVAIYNLLNQFKGYKTSYVDGVAHSAAFIIPFACDHRIMGQGTASLFHNMWTWASGNAKELRQAADRLDKLMESNRKIYLQRSVGLTEEQLMEMMENETMLTPEECLQYGFCDEIIGYVSNAEKQLEHMQTRVNQLKAIEAMQKEIQTQFLQLAQKVEVAPVQLKEGQGESQPKEPEPHNTVQQKAFTFMKAFLNVTNKQAQEEK